MTTRLQEILTQKEHEIEMVMSIDEVERLAGLIQCINEIMKMDLPARD